MKELTKEQKLDFILYCMGEIDDVSYSFYTCNVLVNSWLDKRRMNTSKLSLKLFPELLKYSAQESLIAYYSDGMTFFEGNEIRAIIYSFLYNELTGRIKV